MRRYIFVVISLIFILAFSNSWASEKLQCRSGEENYTHDLTIELENKKVISFSYFSTANHYTCEVNAKRGDKLSSWTDSNKFTSVKLKEGNVVIENRKDSLKINFNDLSHSYYCGMNGQLADEIIVFHANKTCKIK